MSFFLRSQNNGDWSCSKNHGLNFPRQNSTKTHNICSLSTIIIDVPPKIFLSFTVHVTIFFRAPANAHYRRKGKTDGRVKQIYSGEVLHANRTRCFNHMLLLNQTKAKNNGTNISKVITQSRKLRFILLTLRTIKFDGFYRFIIRVSDSQSIVSCPKRDRASHKLLILPGPSFGSHGEWRRQRRKERE